ncbi:MAG: YidC/Oxa1 family insertase periplasmic-domain containing protein, partial [Alistipes sp.]|nr:YidC/Oxa1 family insertase periplasmic-domain containing protein [Alistipes sp.]
MDKKSIIGIAVAALLFLGFAFINGKEQQKYEKAKAEWQAYQDSLAAAARPELSVTPDSAGVAPALAASSEEVAAALREQRVALVGEWLAEAREAAAEEFVVENEVMKVRFSTRGGRIVGVTLKEYTKYGPRDARNELVELFDPATSQFSLNFSVRNGFNTVPVNTMDYTFEADPVVTTPDGARAVTMRLRVAEQSALEYRYLIH